MAPPSLFLIKAMLILNNDGKCLVGRYYDDQFGSAKEKRAFERTIFQKTHKLNGEILMVDKLTVVYRSLNDLFFYVVGAHTENELMLTSILSCLFESVTLVLRRNVEKKFLLANLDMVFLVLDEMCDDGILLEVSPHQIFKRVSLRDGGNDVPLSEQTVFDVLKTAHNQLKTQFK